MVKPDKVTVYLRVETTNKTADAALAANLKIRNKIIDLLKVNGVSMNSSEIVVFFTIVIVTASVTSLTAARPQ